MYVGKGNRPVEVMASSDALVRPIEAEDNPVALVRFESGALGQFEVSWIFRGGRTWSEIAGTQGAIWLNHFLRNGYEVSTSGGVDRYVAEKIECTERWVFAVGDEIVGSVSDMFTDMSTRWTRVASHGDLL